MFTVIDDHRGDYSAVTQMRSRASGIISFRSTSGEFGRSAGASRGAQASTEPARAGLAVLRGVATGLSRREIGARLHISLNTVETDIPEQ